MKNIKSLVFVLFLLLWGMGSGDCYAPNSTVNGIEQRLRSMTLEQRAGQMLMVGFSGKALSQNTQRVMRDCHVGGVILFRPNISNVRQVRKLNANLQRAVGKGGVPLLIATDQEGGRVVRLRHGVPVFPANGKLARTGKIAAIQKAGTLTGRHLRALGINMNLAPVLDVVTTKDRRGIIGDRSFGSNPQVVARWGAEYIRALQKENVLATAKHFPGHGATTTDSHLSLPLVKLSKSELQRTHIAPFRFAVQNQVSAIMPAHIVYSSLDKNKPATLSRPVLQQLLRREIGFKGLVISDSMSMAAISKNRNWESTVVAAVRSGIDVLLLTNSPAHQRRAFRALVQSARREPQMEARITQSCRRVLQAKQRFHIWKP